MELKKFFTVLINTTRKTEEPCYNYPSIATASDRVTNRFALMHGMMPLPKGKANDPSEWWIIARME